MTYANKNFKVVITNMFRTFRKHGHNARTYGNLRWGSDTIKLQKKKKEPKGGSEMKNQVGLTAERGYGRKNKTKQNQGSRRHINRNYPV